MLLAAACIAAPSMAHAEERVDSARPHVVVGGPVAAGVRAVVRVANDPNLLVGEVAGTAPTTGSSTRAPTWLAPEIQKPQYHTTLVEVVF